MIKINNRDWSNQRAKSQLMLSSHFFQEKAKTGKDKFKENLIFRNTLASIQKNRSKLFTII
jgi:hypothetical protein